MDLEIELLMHLLNWIRSELDSKRLKVNIIKC